MADTAVSQETIKVFISYSRADKAFAGDLVLGLAACGFAPYIDRDDIAAGEDWEQRLAGLIAEADTVVYVISPDSLTSENCSWELTESLRAAKRVLPVVWRPVDDAATPVELKRLNYVFFAGEGRSFAAGLSDLAQALRVDIGWIREHTRLGGLAQRWEGRGRSDALLLRGEDLDAAIDWSKLRTPGSPVITDAHADFIKASADARTEAERRAARAKAGLLTAVSAVAVVFAGLAVMSALAWRSSVAARANEAEARTVAEKANADLEVSLQQLAAANVRLSANIGLRAAPSATYLDVAAGWFPVAANYSGAVARIERRGEEGQVYQVATGVLIDGGVVNAALAGEALLLVPLLQTANYEGGSEKFSPAAGLAEGDGVDFSDPNLGPIAQMRVTDAGPLPADAKVVTSLPVVDANLWIETTERVWKTADNLGGVTPFELWRLAAPPPVGARPVVEADIDCLDPYGLVAADNPRAEARDWIASFGVDAGGSSYSGDRAATIFISRMMSPSDPYALEYDHATNLGAAGGPVFDLATGKIFAIHFGSKPDPARPGRRIGLGVSLPMVLADARESMQPREGRLGLMCGLD